jgi:hypothetical protein
VIDSSHYWQQPIRVQHFQSGKTLFLNHSARLIEIDEARDIASIMFVRGDLPFPDRTIPIIEDNYRLKVGTDVSWVGFPAIAPDNLCFFSGNISCWVQKDRFYFVDGVVIPGVSGGPTFAIIYNEVHIIGIVSAYVVPNPSTGAQLPGLCVVRDVFPLYETVKMLRSFEEAKEQEKLPAGRPPARTVDDLIMGQ